VILARTVLVRFLPFDTCPRSDPSQPGRTREVSVIAPTRPFLGGRSDPRDETVTAYLVNGVKVVFEMVVVPFHHVGQVIPFFLFPVRQLGIGLAGGQCRLPCPAHFLEWRWGRGRDWGGNGCGEGGR